MSDVSESKLTFFSQWLWIKSSSSSPSVKRYVRKGIPNEHRPLVWMAASGAQDQLDKNPGYYQSLLGPQTGGNHLHRSAINAPPERRQTCVIELNLFVSKGTLPPFFQTSTEHFQTTSISGRHPAHVGRRLSSMY